MSKLTNPELLAALVLQAVGNRQKKAFAGLIEVTPEYLSRILNSKLANAPSLSILQKIAENAENSVTYAQLLSAAGYAELAEISTPSEVSSLPKNTAKYMSGTILTALSAIGLPFSMVQDDDTGFQLSVTFPSGSISCWHFIFLHSANQDAIHANQKELYSRLIFETHSEDEKISFVTSSREEYDAYTGRTPVNFKLNLSVILIDEKKLAIIQEYWLQTTPAISKQDISLFTL